jgi:flagellar biosynthesis protein FlhG
MADLADHERQRLVDAMGELEEQADIILVDTGAGISPNVLAFTQAADHVLVVTTPEPTAITDAYAVVKVINRRDGRDGRDGGSSRGGRDARGGTDNEDRKLSLLVNQARSPAEARVVYERVARVAKQFLGTTLYDAGSVPLDDQVPAAVRRRTPFVVASPRSAAALSIAQLATKLATGVAPAGHAGFFHRIGGWFR